MKAQYFQCVDTKFDFKSSDKCTGKASLTHPQHIKSERNLMLPLTLKKPFHMPGSTCKMVSAMNLYVINDTLVSLTLIHWTRRVLAAPSGP